MKNHDRPVPLLLSCQEAAHLLGISPRTLFSHTKAGKIPSLKIGRLVKYPLVELQAWIKAQTQRGGAA